MSNHQATEQMLGYLYQIRYALALLLKNDNPDYQISIEKFDDVAFDKDGQPVQLIQLKHHIKQKGNLTDSSADLWRTLKVWIDSLAQKPELLDSTEFLIITTAIAPKDSAAGYLRQNDRDPNIAYTKLKDVCKQSQNTAHQKYYDAFLSADQLTVKKFIKIIYVFLTIFLYLLKCPQSFILSALRAFCFCGKPRISRSIFLYFRYQAWLKSW